MLRMKIRSLSLVVMLSFGSMVLNAQKSGQAAGGERVIHVDFSKTAGRLNTMFNECVGAGRAAEGLRADWQQQLAYVRKECGFRYIRMHGLLTDEMAVYSEDKNGKPQYNFMYVDVLFDFLHSIGMKPFVELGFMPSRLASGSKTIFWWRGNVTPPKDYEKWAGLVRSLVEHCTERYGADEVKTWYFEVWNEPNLGGFWAGTQQDYFKLYSYSARAIKSVNLSYRVGGPATAGAAWEPELIAYCKSNNVPLDFISTHSYGVRQGFLDEFGNTGTVLDKNPMSLSGDVLQSRKEIGQSAMPHLELHYTEWSASYTPADPIHDSYHEAAYVLQKLKQVGNAANSMSYWVFTDIFEEPGPRFTPFHGGFGMLTIQGINKPVFYAYQFLNQLGNIELANSDPSSWVCKDSSGNMQALVWDFTNTEPDSVNNQQYYIRDLPARSKGRLKVSIDNVPAGQYALEVYRTGYRSNDAYSTYLSLGKPAQLNKQEVEQIKDQNDGSPLSREIVTIKNGVPFVKELELRENDVYLVKLIKLARNGTALPRNGTALAQSGTALAQPGTAVKSAGFYENPVFAGDHPDPSILRDGDDYYMVHSSFEYYPGLLIWHSKDLLNWTPVTNALYKYVGSVYAPDLVKYKSKYYIYFPAGGTNYVVTADSINGRWSDPVDLKIGNIDPGHIVDEHGKRYLFFSSGGFVPLSDDGLSVTGEIRSSYSGWPVPRDWSIECFCLEGPKLVKRGEYYYLTVAEGGTAGPATGHMVISARSKSLAGPWENSPYNPIIRTTSNSDRWRSKGHGTLFEDAKGKWWMVFHAYEKGFYNLGRQTLLLPVEWTEDGWYRVPEGIEADQPIGKPELAVSRAGLTVPASDVAGSRPALERTGGALPGTNGPNPGGLRRSRSDEDLPSLDLTWSDKFDGSHLGPQWKFFKEYDTGRFRATANGLIVKAKGDAIGNSSPLLFLPSDHSYTAEVELLVEGGAVGGLVVFYNERAASGILTKDGDILANLNGWQYPAEKKAVTRHVFLRVKNVDNIVDMYYRTEGGEWNKIQSSLDISGFNHNALGGFMAVRIGLCSIGEGAVTFRNFVYKALK